jgi:hypothetical protein
MIEFNELITTLTDKKNIYIIGEMLEHLLVLS